MPPKARKYRLSGWRRLPEEQSEDRSEAHGIDRLAPAERELYSLSLAAFLQEEFDPVASLCQHVWATLGGRVGRDDMIALLNALRVSHQDVRLCVDRQFGQSVGKRLNYAELLAFLHVISDDKSLALTRKRINKLYGVEDEARAPPLPSALWVMLLCALAPITWPLFALNAHRLAGLGPRGLSPAVVLLFEAVFVLGYAPLVLLALRWSELREDRVSTFECFCPALAITLMCVLKAFSIGRGWFLLRADQLHAWRRLRVQKRFTARFARNRILLQRLGVSVYGVPQEAPRHVWAYELLQYLEHTYARPEGLVPDLPPPLAHPTTANALKAGATLVLDRAAHAQARAAHASRASALTIGTLASRVAVGPDALLREPELPLAERAADRYYDTDQPDALDRVTHSLSFDSQQLFSAEWFRTRFQQPRSGALAIAIALTSPAIPCLVRHAVHGLPYLGEHAASRFVVAVNIAYGVPSLLIVLLTLTAFLDMLQFRKLLLRGLTASVRPDLASDSGVRVTLDLRDAVNLSTWFELITYLRMRCLSAEVRPFNSLLLPVALLDLGLCAMFMWEWVAFHVGDEPQDYVISALDILSALSVTWLSGFIWVAMSRACDINIALDEHAEVLESTQVELRMAIRQLRMAARLHAELETAALSHELRALEETDFQLTAIVRKTRNVDMFKPFKLLGVSITSSRLRALGTLLLTGFISGIWRQVDDVLFTSFGITF